MTKRPGTPAAAIRLGALRAEQRAMTEFTAALTEDQWNVPSAAAGWRVRDVVAHLGALSRSMYAPAGAVSALRADDIERENDRGVDRRLEWATSKVLAEYRRSSVRLSTFAAMVTRSPLARMPIPMAGVGRFPLGQMVTSAMVFDHHTHLRHDIIPALDLPEPPTDGHRMSVVTSWMVMVLDEQLRRSPLTWLDAPVSLSLAGEGGGTWVVGPHGVVCKPITAVAAEILVPARSFPLWGTRRAHWGSFDAVVTGDSGVAERFLDSVNVV